MTSRNKAFEKLISKSLSKGKYKHPESCRRDLTSLLRSYRGLAPQFDTFVFDNGEEKSLLNLNGTIPISYRGNTYNIPVCFWVLVDYPRSAPMAFVRPTQDMQIKASDNVDHNGKVSLPYIQEWIYPESNLIELVQICVLVFGQSPPVFSKGKSSSTQSQQSTPIRSQVNGNGQQRSVSSLPVTRQSSLQEERSPPQRRQDDLSEEHLRISLMSAVEDLVKNKLEEEFMKTKAEVQTLHATNKELLDGQEKINDIIRNLETNTKELTEHERAFAEKETELNETLNQLSELDLTSAVEADEVIIVPNALHNQVVEAFALDAAIDDAIYSLGSALHNGVIECDVYLKSVRNLSRKQFLQRVIMAKGKQKAGLERSESTVSNQV